MIATPELLNPAPHSSQSLPIIYARQSFADIVNFVSIRTNNEDIKVRCKYDGINANDL